jgi:hypothetical protein
MGRQTPYKKSLARPDFPDIIPEDFWILEIGRVKGDPIQRLGEQVSG